MTRTGYTHIEVLLDRSGSMDTIKEDMEGGFNSFLADQRALPGQATIGLAQFDTEYETVYSMRDIHSAPRLTLNPRGGTALIDAMVRSIDALGARLNEMTEANRPAKVIVVIITDGYQWEFVYLGANQDAIGEARRYGIQSHSTMDFATSRGGIGSTYSALSSAVTSTRGSGAKVTFTKDQREDAQK